MDMRVCIAGVNFKNPIIAASGTFGFGFEFGNYYDVSLLGGISLKAVTLEPKQGNPPPRIAETPMGMLNSVGLQNPGVEAFIKKELPLISGKDTVLIANIAGNTIEQYCEVARRVSDSDVHMIELNISCPNVKAGGMAFGVEPGPVAEVTESVKKCCTKPLIVKLSPNTTDITANAKAAESAGADALSLINTITGMAIDAKTRRPVLANITGGLSGPAIKPIALRMVYQVAQSVKIPIIGMGGIMSGTDAAEFMLAGASAVMVGTASIADPYACLTVIYELQAYLEQQGASSVCEIIGALKV